jgi:anthranilate synthase/aminodeoxychorismate synthase-like glutamine amidotransferase
MISPGPGHPITDSGVSIAVIKEFAGKRPIFGVCLGHQAIYEMYGGKVDVAGEIMHGKCSEVQHDCKGIFRDIKQNVRVVRYHSLVGFLDTLPSELEVSAKTANGLIMGVRHKTLSIEGVQFHPESFMTEQGMDMIANFLSWNGGTWAECTKA